MTPILKAVFFTDTHIKGVSPRSRIDDYPRAILEKVKWVIDFGIENGVDVFLHGGDYFDTYSVENSVLNAFVGALDKARDHKIPIVGTVGSHDQVGYQIGAMHRSSVGVLEATGVITILRQGETWERNGVFIIGCPHKIDLDLGNNSDYDVIPDKSHPGIKSTILMAHGYITDKPLSYACTLIDDVKTAADVVLSGHYHTGFSPYVRQDGKIFCNPGSLSRDEDNKINRVRKPSCLYLEIFDGAPPSLKIVPISCAHTGQEIFGDIEPISEPDAGDIARMVEYLKQETEAAGKTFDIERAIANVPVGKDPVLVAEARSMALAMVQKVTTESGQ